MNLERHPVSIGARVADAAGEGRSVAWSRVGFVFLCMIAFGLVASNVASSWESILGRLAGAPRQEAR
jgi:hypothetical protein